MEQRDVVPPAALAQRVERGSHVLVPQITTPPPTLMRRACDVRDARLTPELELALERPPLVEAADRRAEEAADVVPALRRDAAERGEADADVEIPERPPDPARNAELEVRDRPARAHDAGELGERGGRIVDVAQEVGEREVVERGVGEGDRRGGRLHELDAVAEPAPRHGEHVRALIEAGHAVPLASSRSATRPVPVATSSTLPPSRGMCETIALRQRGSWPKERSAPSRSYCGPRGAKSSIAWSRRSVISPYPGTVTLVADLERIAAAVARYAPDGGALSAVLPAEPTPGLRGYLCAFETEAGERSWLVVDDEGEAGSIDATSAT